MKKVHVRIMIAEYINGMQVCNMPKESILKSQAILNDFYNTKIKNFDEENN